MKVQCPICGKRIGTFASKDGLRVWRHYAVGRRCYGSEERISTVPVVSPRPNQPQETP